MLRAVLILCCIKLSRCTYYIRNSDNLDRIPTANISNLTTDIILKYNVIETVALDDLPDLPSLRRVDLTGNKLTVFPNLCGVGSTLKILTLRVNKLLTSIPLSHLDCLTVIHNLDLANTGLTEAPYLTPIKIHLKTSTLDSSIWIQFLQNGLRALKHYNCWI